MRRAVSAPSSARACRIGAAAAPGQTLFDPGKSVRPIGFEASPVGIWWALSPIFLRRGLNSGVKAFGLSQELGMAPMPQFGGQDAALALAMRSARSRDSVSRRISSRRNMLSRNSQAQRKPVTPPTMA